MPPAQTSAGPRRLNPPATTPDASAEFAGRRGRPSGGAHSCFTPPPPAHHLVDVDPRVVRELCSGLERPLRRGRRREGKKEGPGRGLEEESGAAGRAVRGECARGAAPGCAPGSRSSGRLRDCAPRCSPAGPGGFVQPRRTPSVGRTGRAEPPPGAPSALSPPRRHPALLRPGWGCGAPGAEPPPPGPRSSPPPGNRRAPG